MFAHVVAKLGIQRERPRVKARLNQPHSGEVPLRRTLVHRVHQTSANRAILHCRIDRDRSNTCDRIAFVEKIAADNLPIDFRDDRIKLRMREHPA